LEIGSKIEASRVLSYKRTASIIAGVITTASRVLSYIRTATITIGIITTALRIIHEALLRIYHVSFAQDLIIVNC